jgi:hypothetical protein
MSTVTTVRGATCDGRVRGNSPPPPVSGVPGGGRLARRKSSCNRCRSRRRVELLERMGFPTPTAAASFGPVADAVVVGLTATFHLDPPVVKVASLPGGSPASNPHRALAPSELHLNASAGESCASRQLSSGSQASTASNRTLPTISACATSRRTVVATRCMA